jgi:multidrug efflux pump subunit AcrB
MNISAWSIRHPVPVILLFTLLTFLGVKSFKTLGIQDFPDIDLPTITVNASLEGAAPSQLETEVARKIENQIATLDGIEHIRTTITNGSASIRVEFNIDKDVDVALNEVRNAVDSIKADLPASMTSPTVSKITTAGSAILTFTIEAPSMTEEAISWMIDNDVSKALLAVKGVGKVSRIGGVTREVHVDLDPIKMQALGVTAADISNQLKQVQQDSSGGRSDIGGNIQSIRTLAAAQDTQDIEALTIPLGDGRTVRLSDIAQVKDTVAERTNYALLNGKQVVGFEIMRSKGTGAVAVADGVRKTVAGFQAQHPYLKITEAADTVEPIVDNFNGSMELLYEGAFLAIVVVYLFLRDWRATFVSAVALPLSIIPTFFVMQHLGYTLNTLTLLALALVVGILVDDAIVEIENIVRHLQMGKTPYEAAMEAADEIGLAVIATTFSLIAVFLPTAFMPGVPGKFFEQFGITASVAVFASLMVARLLTPMMAAYFLKPHAEEKHADSPVKAAYLRLVNWCLHHRVITMVLTLAFFIGSVMLVPMLPKGFVPVADSARTSVKIELQPGSTLDETYNAAEQARKIISQVDGVIQVFSNVGTGGGTGGPMGQSGSADVRKATLTVKLIHRNERKRKQTAIEAEMRQRLQVLPGARVSVGVGGSGEILQVTLAGENAALLQEASQAVERDLRTLKGIGNIKSSASLQRPELHILPDYVKAGDLGITAGALSNAVRLATSGDFATSLPKLNLDERQVNIRVQLDPTWRTNLDSIRNLGVKSLRGEVPLATVASIKMGSGPAQIDRLDRKRNVTFEVELGSRIIGDVQADVAKLPSLQNLPAGVTQPKSGEAERMAELFSSFGNAMLVGVLLIYIVLVLLFHDFLQPLTILAALPLSFGGAFVALLITHNSFSMPSVIGILMLMGIAAKNSILLVDYAVMAYKEHGMPLYDAVLDACRKRAQPIIMTTIAMGAGMLPVALGLGAEPSFRSPMAIVVIGGLLTSTLLSLLVIPVIFTYVDDFEKLIRKLFKYFKRHSDQQSVKLSA